MVKVLRYAGLIASGMWAQLASGIGVLAFVAAFFIGWRRMRIVWILAPSAAFAVLALGWLGKVSGQSKLSAALSHGGFEFLVTLTICLGGYLAGRLLRRLL